MVTYAGTMNQYRIDNTCITTTGTINSAIWQQWIRPSMTSNTTRIATSYVQGTTAASTTWDQWRDVGYITEPVAWQRDVWDEWIEDEAEREEHRLMRQRERDELQARREQRSREELARHQARAAELEVARVRARELLDSIVAEGDRVPHLDLLQVEGSDGHLYRIEMHRDTVHGNIVEVDEHGCMLRRACVAPRMYDDHGRNVLPTEDGWVGQYLGLKFDAETFLKRANWSNIRACHERVAA